MSCNPYFNLSVLDESKMVSTYEDALKYENNVASRYDAATLSRVCSGATILFQATDKSKYPAIADRFAGGVPLGTEEMAEFIKWSNRTEDRTLQFVDIILETDVGYRYEPERNEYVPIIVETGDSDGVSSPNLNSGVALIGNDMMIVSPEQRQAATTIISDYEYFLNDGMSSGIVGLFCSIFANPYKVLEIIDDIRNFKIPTMKEVVDGIKERVGNIIASVIDTVKRKYENLKETIIGFANRHKATMKVLQNKVESVSEMFREGNIEKMKKAVTTLINKTFSQFREVTQEVLQFIMYRMCKLASQIEQDIMQPIYNIEKMKDVYDYNRNAMRINGEARTRSYVGNGSVRYSTSDRYSMRQQSYMDAGGYASMDIDALVDAVEMVESGGDPNAYNSRTGASGAMQIMQHTAQDPGFGVTPLDWSKRFDRASSRAFGTEYLQAMIKRYDGDQVKALAAYNWGVGNADRWDGDMNTLPNETRNYIRKIMGASAQSGSAVTPSVFVAAEITEEEDQWVYGITGGSASPLVFTDSVRSMGAKSRAHWEANRLPNYRSGDNYDDAGWKQIVQNNPSVFIMLRRVAKRMGKSLTVNSAFRSLYYNQYVIRAETGANSPHSRAIAVDISTNGMSEGHKAEFIKYCSQEGFSRISVYDSFIHVDIANGPGRGDWTRNYQGSSLIRDAMMMHLQDRFRKG